MLGSCQGDVVWYIGSVCQFLFVLPGGPVFAVVLALLVSLSGPIREMQRVFLGQDKVASGDQSGVLMAHDIDTGTVVNQWHSHDNVVSTCAITKNDQRTVPYHPISTRKYHKAKK